MRVMLYLVLAFAGCLASALAVRAFTVPPAPGTVQALMDCSEEHTYNAGSVGAPAAIAASFAGKGARLAFRTCRDTSKNLHYFLREHRPNRNGVCRSFEKEVFPGAPGDGVHVNLLYDGTAPDWYFVLRGWTQDPPEAWRRLRYPERSRELGFITDGDCPPGDDARYMFLANMTDGTLKSFQQAWSRITATPESLRAAAAPLPVQLTGIRLLDTPERQQRLRDGLVARVFENHERPVAFACDSGGCSATFDTFYVLFDVGTGGIALTGLATVFRA